MPIRFKETTGAAIARRRGQIAGIADVDAPLLPSPQPSGDGRIEAAKLRHGFVDDRGIDNRGALVRMSRSMSPPRPAGSAC
jgi:hypothetical protein